LNTAEESKRWRTLFPQKPSRKNYPSSCNNAPKHSSSIDATETIYVIFVFGSTWLVN